MLEGKRLLLHVDCVWLGSRLYTPPDLGTCVVEPRVTREYGRLDIKCHQWRALAYRVRVKASMLGGVLEFIQLGAEMSP